MLSLSKKGETQLVAAPLWHTNFRNFERLPDTKVVRTTFFINTAAIAMALGLLLWLGYREYHVYNLGEQIVDAQKQIDSNSPQNKEALRLSKVFADEQNKLAEAEAFQRSVISPIEFINLLGRTLPKVVSIEFVDARLGDTNPSVFAVRGLVAGTRDQASGAASSYVDMLRADPRLGAVFDPITLTKLDPDSRSGLLTFEIVFKIKSGAKEKK